MPTPKERSDRAQEAAAQMEKLRREEEADLAEPIPHVDSIFPLEDPEIIHEEEPLTELHD